MLAKDPDERISLKEIKEHRWMTIGDAGQTFMLDTSILSKLRVIPEVVAALDGYVVSMLQFTPAQKERVFDDLKNGHNTRDAMMYKIARKTSMCYSLGSSDDLFFVPVKDIVQTTARHALPALSRCKVVSMTKRRVRTQVIADTNKVFVKKQLMVNYRRHAVSKIENAALSRLNKIV